MKLALIMSVSYAIYHYIYMPHLTKQLFVNKIERIGKRFYLLPCSEAYPA
jgi:hypothetical protein